MVDTLDHSGIECDLTLLSDDLAFLSRVARRSAADRYSSSAKWNTALGHGRKIARCRGKDAALLKQSGKSDGLRAELGRNLRAEGSAIGRIIRQHARRAVHSVGNVVFCLFEGHLLSGVNMLLVPPRRLGWS